MKVKEPLFRGKSEENGEWMYGFGWFKSDLTKEYKKESGVKDYATLITDSGPVYCILETMGQFSGAYSDKMEKLFEGDEVQLIAGDPVDEELLGGEYFFGTIVFEEGSYWVVNEEDQDAVPLFHETISVVLTGSKYENTVN